MIRTWERVLSREGPKMSRFNVFSRNVKTIIFQTFSLTEWDIHFWEKIEQAF